MKRPPRDPKEPILSGLLVWRILFVSTIIILGTFGLFLWERLHGASIEKARTVAVNTLVMFEIFYLFNTRSLKDPIYRLRDLTGNPYVYFAILFVLGAQMIFTYTAPIQRLFGNAAIPALAWVRILLIAMSVFFLVEMEKRIVRRWTVRKEHFPDRPTVQFLR